MQWYSGFLRRLIAFIIDIFVITLFIGFIEFILGFINGALFNFLIFFLVWGYFAIQESSARKGTVGKQAMNIIVTDIYGNKISFIQAIIRFFGKLIGAIPLFAGFFLIFFTVKKQGLHDIIVKTVVFVQED